jgi:hypothetical protein
VEVDLDDPFFRNLEVQAEAPTDFARLGLRTVQVALEHGSAASPGGPKHGDLEFQAEGPTRQSFRCALEPGQLGRFRAEVQYHFLADSPWVAPGQLLAPPAAETTDRSLVLEPSNFASFIEVELIPHRIDSQLIEAIEVVLWVEGPGAAPETRLRLVPEQRGLVWRTRVHRPGVSAYRYRFEHLLRTGQRLVGRDQVGQGRSLLVEDPFPAGIELNLMPLWDPALTRQVFVELAYADPASGQQREQRLQLPGTATEPRSLRLGLERPGTKTFRWRQTQVRTDNKLERGPWVETEDTLLPLFDLPLPE